jgi:hypothetical protein
MLPARVKVLTLFSYQVVFVAKQFLIVLKHYTPVVGLFTSKELPSLFDRYSYYFCTFILVVLVNKMMQSVFVLMGHTKLHTITLWVGAH